MDSKRLAASLLSVLFALCNLRTYHAANILFFWGFSGYSHRITAWPLIEKLAAHGHNITFFSPFSSKTPVSHPNINEITSDGLLEGIGMDFDPLEVRMNGGVSAIQALWPIYLESGVLLCKRILQNVEMQSLSNSASFDLVVINGLLNDCGYGYAWKFKAPTIVYATSSVFPWWGDTYGIPEENYPGSHFHFPINMTFSQQVWNALTPLYWLILRRWSYLPALESVIRPALNIPDMLPLDEMDRRSSLILMNTHYSEEYPRSLPPWVVSVGGMHVSNKTKPLPPKMQKFINSWKDGFIYFSFGTHMKLPLFPQSHQNSIFGAMQKFPNIGFVVKWNGGEVPKDLPPNVMTAEWMAQRDILSQPNIRAFIAHGGILGTQEAVFNAVPMVVFPIMAEQDYNAQRIHSAERGVQLEISELTEEKLENAIREVLTNKKYKENMVKASKIFRDRPATPADTAVWWVEYVLRHKETPFLKPIGLNRTWYEKRMLHIWGFISVALITALLLILLSLRLVMKIAFGGIKQKLKTH